ncbi:cupin domain-containing protein [Woodsholea maritima]|uniref:cupin domain-containing protein n=1 Tax=Woodsholea maritima TaxID=240237 RepID=UPI000371C2FB|nr:cupin domain-containing protein [Woodsholea maritima]
MTPAQTTAQDMIAQLDLSAHPEGGWYRETCREGEAGQRADVTMIYFLLEGGQRSTWHTVDAHEIWLWHAGAPLSLETYREGQNVERQTLSDKLTAGHTLQGLVPKGVWQSAISQGDWTLVSCVVAPGFEFSGFKLAAKDWQPGA